MPLAVYRGDSKPEGGHSTSRRQMPNVSVCFCRLGKHEVTVNFRPIPIDRPSNVCLGLCDQRLNASARSHCDPSRRSIREVLLRDDNQSSSQRLPCLTRRSSYPASIGGPPCAISA